MLITVYGGYCTKLLGLLGGWYWLLGGGCEFAGVGYPWENCIWGRGGGYGDCAW